MTRAAVREGTSVSSFALLAEVVFLGESERLARLANLELSSLAAALLALGEAIPSATGFSRDAGALAVAMFAFASAVSRDTHGIGVGAAQTAAAGLLRPVQEKIFLGRAC